MMLHADHSFKRKKNTCLYTNFKTIYAYWGKRKLVGFIIYQLPGPWTLVIRYSKQKSQYLAEYILKT